MRRPRLRADFEAVVLPRPDAEGGDYLVMAGESRSLLIEDPVVAALASYLDGTRETADVLTCLPYPPAVAARALRRLRGLDLLVDGRPAAPAAQVAAWDARGLDADRAEAYADSGHLLLLDGAGSTATALAGALAPLAGTVTTVDLVGGPAAMKDAPNAVVVATVASMLDPRLSAINDFCLETGRAWLLTRPCGTVVMAGPQLVPGQTGCWACLHQRWSENEQLQRYLAVRRPQRRTEPPPAALLATAVLVAGLIGAELPAIAVRGSSTALAGRMIALDTVELTTSVHQLVRQPQCPACGDPQRPAAAPVVNRDEPASASFARLEHHISRYLGAVTRLARLEEDNGVSFSYSAGHNFAVARHPAMLRDNLRGQSGGKGRTESQARMSALGEAIERYAGVWRGDRPERRARYADLGLELAVPIRELTGFSERQYAERDATNTRYSHFHHVPRPAGDDLELDWTPAWSLTFERPRLLPSVYCWYGHPQLELDVCVADSNGSAAGITAPAAIWQGFCELVERDAVALWWQHRSRLPGVDLDAFGDPWLAAVRAYHEGLGRRLWALDLTADLGVPTFAAVSYDVWRPTPDVLLGFGAHRDAAAALARAVAEVNQFLPAVARTDGAGRTRYGLTEPETVRWMTTVHPDEHDWLLPDPAAPLSTADSRPPVTGTVVDIAARAGLEVIVVDQTRPDIDLAVVKVVVPGLRHFWRRLGPGRLWEIPARLGRTPLASDESAVNPLNVFF